MIIERTTYPIREVEFNYLLTRYALDSLRQTYHQSWIMNMKLTLICCLLLFVGCKNVSTEREVLAKVELLLENISDNALLIIDDLITRSDLSDNIKY